MADSLLRFVQWSTPSCSIREFLVNYESRFPMLALVTSVGDPSKSAYNLTPTETLFIGQVIKIESATESQKRLITEVVPQGLSLNIPLDCPAKFDIPRFKKKKLKLEKIVSSSKYQLPLSAETSTKYNAYFEKAGAKATGDAKKLTVKMILKKVTDERFLRTNFIDEGIESPLVTFISADVPIELAIVESYIGQGTQGRLRDMYQLSPVAAKAKAKVIGKGKKRPADGQVVFGAGLYIMAETSANSNCITSEDGSAAPPSSGAAAAAAAAPTEDDVDGIDMEDSQIEDAVQDIALDSEQNHRINRTAPAAAAAVAAELKESSSLRNGDLSASTSGRRCLMQQPQTHA